ncbi:MAG: DUF4402 domain-containing protein, partial [Candidatus Zixiibacteriota bacterium]
ITGSGGDISTAGDLAVNGGDITSTSTTLTLGGSITTLNCTDCIDFDDLEDTLDLDAALTLNQGTNTWTQNYTGTTGTGLSYVANSLTTGEILDLTGAFSPTAGGTQSAIDINLTNSPSTTANTLRGIDVGFTDSGTLANTVYGLYVDATTANANDTTYAAVFQGGNVGIGTTGPGYKLTVATSGNNDGLYVTKPDGTILGALHVGGGSAGKLDLFNNGGLSVVALSSNGASYVNGTLAVGTNNPGAARLNVTGDESNPVATFMSGNVGIGTTGPDAKLDSLATSGEQLRLTYTDGSVYTGFTVGSGGDLTVDATGGQIAFADADTLNIGGLTGVAYNALANAVDAPDEAAIAADNDLYIGGDLEVDGTIYGNVSGSAGSVKWNAITNPDGALSLSHNENATTFTWDTAATAAALDGLTLALTNDATTDATSQRLLVLKANSAVGGGTTERLLVLDNADDTAVTTGL